MLWKLSSVTRVAFITREFKFGKSDQYVLVFVVIKIINNEKVSIAR